MIIRDWTNDYLSDSIFKEGFQNLKSTDAHKDEIYSEYSLDGGKLWMEDKLAVSVWKGSEEHDTFNPTFLNDGLGARTRKVAGVIGRIGSALAPHPLAEPSAPAIVLVIVQLNH